MSWPKLIAASLIGRRRYQNLETGRRQQIPRLLGQGAILEYSPAQAHARDTAVPAHGERLVAHGVRETSETSPRAVPDRRACPAVPARGAPSRCATCHPRRARAAMQWVVRCAGRALPGASAPGLRNSHPGRRPAEHRRRRTGGRPRSSRACSNPLPKRRAATGRPGVLRPAMIVRIPSTTPVPSARAGARRARRPAHETDGSLQRGSRRLALPTAPRHPTMWSPARGPCRPK